MFKRNKYNAAVKRIANPKRHNQYENKETELTPTKRTFSQFRLNDLLGCSAEDFIAMEEYKIISGTTVECQKLLNKWKHQYFLNIINMCADKDLTVILLTRTKKVDE